MTDGVIAWLVVVLYYAVALIVFVRWKASDGEKNWALRWVLPLGIVLGYAAGIVARTVLGARRGPSG